MKLPVLFKQAAHGTCICHRLLLGSGVGGREGAAEFPTRVLASISGFQLPIDSQTAKYATLLKKLVSHSVKRAILTPATTKNSVKALV